jgi:hypothetical protein
MQVYASMRSHVIRPAIEPFPIKRIFPPRGEYDPVEMLRLSRKVRVLGPSSRAKAKEFRVEPPMQYEERRRRAGGGTSFNPCQLLVARKYWMQGSPLHQGQVHDPGS